MIVPSTPKPPRDSAAPVDAGSRGLLFASVMANVKDAVLVTEAEPVDLASGGPRIIYVNEAFTAMTGYSAEQAIGRTPRMLQSPDTDQSELDRLRRALRRWEPVEVELLNVHSDGSEFWVQFIIVPVANADGWFTHWISVQRDVTARRRREEELVAVIRGTTDVVALVSLDGTIRASSPAADRAIHRDGTGLAQSNILDLLAPDQRDAALLSLQEAGRPRASDLSGELEVVTARGPRCFEVTSTLQSIEATDIGLVLTAVDVTERRQVQAALEKAQRRFEGAFADAPIGMAVLARDGRLLEVNAQLRRLLGRDESELLALSLDDLIHPEDRVASHAEREEIFGGQLAVGRREARLLHADGRVVGVMVSTSIVRRDGAVIELVAHIEDITERQALEARLKHQALHDALTELPNRVLFVDRLETALRRSERSGTPVSVLFFDLDGFKAINDALGHAGGDYVLRTVAERVGELLRSGDTVARLGGDEFTVLCDEAGPEQASHVAKRIIEALEQPIATIAHDDVRVRASIGIATNTGPDDTADSLLRDADMAMYAAKETSDVHYAIFDEHLRERALARLNHETELRRAIAEDQLVLHYQPLFTLRDDDGPVEFEALVRWQHPERGLLAPGAFIPMAEQSGLIVEVDHWVLRTACAETAQLPFDDAKVWVNISLRTLSQPTLSERVQASLEAAGLAARRLGLEITERTVVEGDDAARTAIEHLRSLGVTFAADDFGTGYSSLSALIEHPVDVLKIDRSFVDGLPAPESVAVVRAIVALASALGLQTVAEGVERDEQLRTVRELGSDLAQGYLLARPMTGEALVEHYARGVTPRALER